MQDERLHSAACERNREPILRVLEGTLADLDEGALVLEIASGTGMHAVFFAARLPRVIWQPSDADDAALRSIAAWRAAEPSPNLRAPLRLDVRSERWPLDRADAIFNANMIHISPWESCLGLFEGAERILTRQRAPLILYGPFKIDGAHTAPSNAAFDDSLRARDPRWGVRDLADVTAVAREHGFAHDRTVPMPANNLCVVFRRDP